MGNRSAPACGARAHDGRYCFVDDRQLPVRCLAKRNFRRRRSVAGGRWRLRAPLFFGGEKNGGDRDADGAWSQPGRGVAADYAAGTESHGDRIACRAFRRVRRDAIARDASVWSLENLDAVVGSFTAHNNHKDYEKMFHGFNCKEMVALDFGCGPGELLFKLPEGSIGYEINNEAVKLCKSNNLNVELYEPDSDDYSFKICKDQIFQTLILSHVLEHIENADIVLKKILDNCPKLKVDRIIIIVPGIKGFKSDATHKTFIDYNFIKKKHLDIHNYYKIS